MSLPTLGETYSLLADVRSTEIQKQREEEQEFQRQLRRDARRDQLRAAFFQPIVGSIASTGIKVLGDVVGKAILPNAGRKFPDTEAGRRAKTDAAYQQRNLKKLSSLISKLSDPDALIKSQLPEMQQAYALQMGAPDFDSLDEIQKTSFNTFVNNNDAKFKNEITKLNSEVQDIYTTIAGTKNYEAIQTALNKADNYFGKTPGEKVGTFLIDRALSIFPGKKRTDFTRQPIIEAVVGQTPESEWTDSERYYIDFLSGVTKDGKPLQGPAARDYALLTALQKDASNLDDTFYGIVAKSAGFSDEVKRASANIASSLDLRTKQSAENINPDNIFSALSFSNSSSVYNHSSEYTKVFQDSIFTSKTGENIIGDLASGNSERYSALVKKIQEQTELREDKVQDSLIALAPELLSKTKNGLQQYFLNSTKNKNINPFLVGNKNPEEIKTLIVDVMYEALENDLILKEGGGFLRGDSPAVRIGFQPNKKYSSINAARFLSRFNPETPNLEVSTGAIAFNPGSEQGNTTYIIDQTSISMTNVIEQLRKNNVSSSDIKTQITQLYAQLQDSSKFRRDFNTEEDLKEFFIAKENILDSLEDSSSQRRLFNRPGGDRFDSFNPAPDTPSILGDIKNLGMNIQKRRVRLLLEDLQRNPRPPEEFFRFRDILDMSGVTPELMKEVGFTDEYIQYAQQITKDTSDSLLAK
tara:strand:+ start:1184 stop:3274 length:2091 start_codon:yes stop_codon:yes gene_type:complete